MDLCRPSGQYHGSWHSSTGHQQPWYWLCKIYQVVVFHYGRCPISVSRKDNKCKCIIIFPQNLSFLYDMKNVFIYIYIGMIQRVCLVPDSSLMFPYHFKLYRILLLCKWENKHHNKTHECINIQPLPISDILWICMLCHALEIKPRQAHVMMHLVNLVSPCPPSVW